MNVGIWIYISGFPAGNRWGITNGWRQETFAWSDILRAAIVTGYPMLTAIPSRQFARWRTAGFHLALRHASGELVQPPEWDRLDPSEKGAASSLLGLVVTKLTVERLLHAPIFLFLDIYFAVMVPAGAKRRRPDFIARTITGRWIPAEAKGKSRFWPKTLTNGKEQACGIGWVNGQRVSTAVVCVTSFRKGVMQARFADPEADEDEAGALGGEPMQAVHGYYHQLNRFKQTSERLGEQPIPNSDIVVELWRSPELDAEFGVVPELQAALEQRSLRAVDVVLKKLDAEDAATGTPFLGPDGIAVIPGRTWRDDSVVDRV